MAGFFKDNPAVTADAYTQDALTSKNAAEAAKVAAEAAKVAAEAAKAAAETAEANAETAEANAETAANSVSTGASTATTKAGESAASATQAATSAGQAAASNSAATASQTAAASSATSASSSASTATNKAGEAATSATNAAGSATSAATSASTSTTQASNSAASAASSLTAKNAAETAETNAETAETNAAASESAAAASAAQSASSASQSASSASSASASETAAVSSATSASNSSNTSTTKAGEAATSASNAATSEANASSSASTSTTQATNSAASAASSLTAKNASEAAQVAAETAESNAASSATSASNSATTATTQAGTSTTQAGNSATSATAASNSASSAASAQTAAEAARDSALAALDSFDDRYLGSKSSAPSQDNDGNALVSGALYFDSTSSAMRVYDGSNWLNAYASLSGALIANQNLSDLNNAATARTNLGLGTAATTASSAYATAAQADQTVSLTGAGATSISGTYPNFTITSTDTNTGTTYSAGSGITLSGTTFSNAAPDQTVSLTGAGATSISGTYPNFTITGTDTNTTYSVGDGGLTQNNFTNALKSKLDGVEASADVTDTTNVVAALTAGTNVTIASDGTISSTDTNTNTTYSAGSGISLSGTTFSNSAPDQTVSLTGAGATTISGAYPNFTITSTDTNTTYSVGDGGLTQNNFTTTLKNKLDGIEASADVTDTANVVGALTAGTNVTIGSNGTISATGGVDGISSAASSNAMHIDSSGRIGFGTTNPSAWYYDDFVFTSGNAGTSITIAGTGASGGESQILFSDGSFSSQSYTGFIKYAHNQAAGGTGPTMTTDWMAFGTNGQQRLRIDNAGNVGIGNGYSPSEKLDVNGTVRATNYKIGTDQGSDGQVLTSTGSGVAWEAPAGVAGISSAASSNAMHIDSAGRIGFGTNNPSAWSYYNDLVLESGNPKSAIVIAGTSASGGQSLLLFSDGSGSGPSGYAGFISYTHNQASGGTGPGLTTDYMSIGANGGARIRIDNAGNVGIGNDYSPSEKLDVNGTIRATNYKIGTDQGSDGDVLTSTGSGVAWEAPAGGGITSHNINGLGSNRFYAGLISVNGGSTSTLSTTTLDYLPFQVFEDCVIDGLNIIIDGGTGNSGDLAQIAIYGPVSQDLSAAARKVVSSSFAVDSGYGKTISITATSFTAGVYLYCITANTASLDIRKYESQGKYANYMVGSNSASFAGGISSHQYGQNTVTTFPHSYPTSVSASQANPSTTAYQFRYQVQ